MAGGPHGPGAGLAASRSEWRDRESHAEAMWPHTVSVLHSLIQKTSREHCREPGTALGSRLQPEQTPQPHREWSGGIQQASDTVGEGCGARGAGCRSCSRAFRRAHTSTTEVVVREHWARSWAATEERTPEHWVTCWAGQGTVHTSPRCRKFCSRWKSLYLSICSSIYLSIIYPSLYSSI